MHRLFTSGALVALVAIGVVAPSHANAQSLPLDEDEGTPRMLALGGRAEAASSSTAALYANPAMLSATRGYATDALFTYDPTVSHFNVGSALVDSTRSFVAAGLAYNYASTANGTDNRNFNDVRASISFALGSLISIGGTIRYLNATNGPVPLNGGSLQQGVFSGILFDGGVSIRPATWLAITASGHNLNNTGNTAAPINVGMGLAVTPMSMLTFVGDAVLDFRSTNATRGRYSGGIELFLGNHFPLRVGYLYDDVRGGAQAITGGIGYLDENFGVEFSLRQAFIPDAQTTMMVSLRYFYRGALQ